MAAVVASHPQLMPGSFAPEDYIDIHENPFDISRDMEHEQTNQPAQKHTISHIHEPSDSCQDDTPLPPPPDPKDVDWHKYKPPSLLRKAPTVNSHILQAIIESSVDNVISRVAEEDRIKDQAEQDRVREETAAKQAAKAKRLYLPIIIPDNDDPAAESVAGKTEKQRQASLDVLRSDDARRQTLTVANSSTVPNKAKRFTFRRLFHRSPENGESSAAGAARETLRGKLRAKLGSLDPDIVDLLARDAISRIGDIGVSLTSEGSDNLIECVSCLDEFPARKMVRVPCHHYCTDCFIRLISAAVQNEQQWPPKCCLNPIPFRTIFQVVPADLKTTFQARSSEWEIPVSERVYCNQADCSLWIKPDQISHAMRQGRCDRGHLTCTLCRGSSHGQNECPQDRDMDLTNRLAEEEGWRRCFSCHALVEHKEACQHMTCRCGTQFCYVCGERWRTCGCTMQQLHELKEGVLARRRQRIFQQQEEAAELTRILAQIEELERQEALAAELRRQEEEKLEAERRQREVEERALAESIRRRDIGQKFQQIRESLDQVHELQQVLLETQQEVDSRDLEVEIKAVQEQLQAKQEAERQATAASMADRLAQKEQEQKHDFASRVNDEEEVEEQYHQQLVSYWAGEANEKEKIEAAMLSLRRRMDQACQQWRQWRDAELAAYKQKLKDRRDIQEELMHSIRLRMEDQFEEKKVDLAKRKVAEIKWLEEVMLERERLLDECEMEELEGDADSLFAPADSDGGTGMEGVEDST